MNNNLSISEYRHHRDNTLDAPPTSSYKGPLPTEALLTNTPLSFNQHIRKHYVGFREHLRSLQSTF